MPLPARLEHGHPRPPLVDGLHLHQAEVHGAAPAVAHQQVALEGVAVEALEAVQVVGGRGHGLALDLDLADALLAEGRDQLLALGLQILQLPDLGDGDDDPARLAVHFPVDLSEQLSDEVADDRLRGLLKAGPMVRDDGRGLTEQHLEVLIHRPAGVADPGLGRDAVGALVLAPGLERDDAWHVLGLLLGVAELPAPAGRRRPWC